MKKILALFGIVMSLTLVACGGGSEADSANGFQLSLVPSVSVALANDSPASSVVVSGQATADLAHFTFAGNDTITDLKFMRTGVSSNSTLSNVYLFEGNTRVTDAVSVNTDGSININNVNLAVNGSRTLRVAADIAAGTSGQIIGVHLVSYTTSGNTTKTVSISGNQMNVASALLATVDLGANTVLSASASVGHVNYILWSAPITAGIHPVVIKNITFKYTGPAPLVPLAHTSFYLNGFQYGTLGVVNTATNTISFDFSSTPIISVGATGLIQIRADIVGGSGQTVMLSLQNSADLMVTDSLLGVNVVPTAFTSNDGGVISIY